MFSFSSLVV